MSDPITAGIVLGSVGAAGSGFSQFQKSRRDERNAKRQAAAANLNAALTGEFVQREARLIRRRGDKLASSQIAAVGASGITLSGSALDIINETAEKVEFQALDTLYQGYLEVQGLQIEAKSLRNQASSIRRSRPLELGASLLSSVGRGFLAAGAGAGE